MVVNAKFPTKMFTSGSPHVWVYTVPPSSAHAVRAPCQRGTAETLRAEESRSTTPEKGGNDKGCSTRHTAGRQRPTAVAAWAAEADVRRCVGLGKGERLQTALLLAARA